MNAKACERCDGTGEIWDAYWTCGDPECCGSGRGECPDCGGTGKQDDTGLQVIDCTDVQIGNSDIPVPEYAPTESKERPPLPIYPRPGDLPSLEDMK